MASENNLTAVFTDIANAIRDKKGSVDTIKPINMADEILTIETKSPIYSALEAMGTNWSRAFYVDTTKISVFYYITELSESDIPPSNNVDSMNYMFWNCLNLTSVSQLDTSSCTSLYGMFYNCQKLTSIPQLDTSSSTNMGYMFYQCSKLEKIDITTLASSNNSFAYRGWSLKTLIIRTMDTIPDLNSNAFEDCYHFYGITDSTYNPNGLKDGRIYVPDDKVETLKTTTNWSVFADIIKPLSEYVE